MKSLFFAMFAFVFYSCSNSTEEVKTDVNGSVDSLNKLKTQVAADSNIVSYNKELFFKESLIR